MHKPYASIHTNTGPLIEILLSPDLCWELCLFLAEDVSTAGINSIRLFCKFFIISCTYVSYLHCNIQLKTCKLDLGETGH